MTVCTDCLKLGDENGPTSITRDIVPLALSSKRCSLCRFLCSFFEIPVESIRDGTHMAFRGATWLSNDARRSLGLHQPGLKLKHCCRIQNNPRQNPYLAHFSTTPPPPPPWPSKGPDARSHPPNQPPFRLVKLVVTEDSESTPWGYV